MEEQGPKPGNNFFPQGLKWYEHVACGWPLVLVFVGGAIGGACGGAAYMINGNIFKADHPTPLKYVYSFLVGIGAIVLYFGCAMILVTVFPGLRKT